MNFKRGFGKCYSTFGKQLYRLQPTNSPPPCVVLRNRSLASHVCSLALASRSLSSMLRCKCTGNPVSKRVGGELQLTY